MSLLATVLAVVLAVVFVVAGLNKFSGSELAEQAPEHLRISVVFYRLAGVLELLGSAGLAIGAVASPFLAGLAAGCLCCLMIGAVALHLRAGDGFGIGAVGSQVAGSADGLSAWAPAAGLGLLSAFTAYLIFTV